MGNCPFRHLGSSDGSKYLYARITSFAEVQISHIPRQADKKDGMVEYYLKCSSNISTSAIAVTQSLQVGGLDEADMGIS